MRLLLFILIILIHTETIVGQNLKQDSLAERLYTEVVASYAVESKHIGCYGNLSVLYKKVDTLKQTVGLKSFIDYFNTPSVNLKYYAFIEILASGDEFAFKKLTEIANSIDTIHFDFAGQFRGQIRLLELLTGEYLGFIKMKYYYGGAGTYHNRVYRFDKRDRSTWRRKKARVAEFITTNNLSEEWVENYSR